MLGRKSLSVIEKGVRSCCHLRNSRTRQIHSSPVSPAPFSWGITVVPENQAFVIQRFRKHVKTLPPGLYFLIPFVDRVAFTVVCEQQPKSSAQDSTEADDASVETDFEVKIVNPTLSGGCLANEALKLAKTTMGEDFGAMDLNMEEMAVGDRKTVILKFRRI